MTQSNFKDSMGREWFVRIDIGLCRRVLNTTGVDMLSPEQAHKIVGLQLNRDKLADILWIIVEKQAAIKNVTQEALYEALDGEALNAGYEAILANYVDFFPTGRVQDAVRLVIQETKAAQEKAFTEAKAYLSSPEYKAQIDSVLTAAMNDAKEQLAALGS
jgi:hypothetical protein